MADKGSTSTGNRRACMESIGWGTRLDQEFIGDGEEERTDWTGGKLTGW